MDRDAPLLFLDSGIGGLSVLGPTRALLPEGASGFTTIELKSNHLSTAREGRISCEATNVHAGRTTQVWDAVVRNDATGKTVALFRCTQSVLWPR